MKTKAPNLQLIVLLCMMFNTTSGQIKIHNDNWISIGSLTKSFGIQVEPNGYTYFQPSVYGEYAFMNLTYATDDKSKCYIVERDSAHTFFVLGEGWVYSRNQYLGMSQEFLDNTSDLNDPLSTVCSLHGISFLTNQLENPLDTNSFTDKYGKVHKILTKGNDVIDEQKRRHIGVIAQEVEKVAPELVRTMPDGTKAVEPIGFIGLLIEAIKEQHREISRLSEEVNNMQEVTLKQSSNNSGKNKSSGKETESENILYQNTPNPFSVNTTIRYSLASEIRQASLLIFNFQGVLLKSYDKLEPNQGHIIINANEFTPGIYLYGLIGDGKEIDVKRMILTEK